MPDEQLTTLLDEGEVRIERIVSQGHASPQRFWFDQEQHEWVIVVRGEATLRFEGVEQLVNLKAGDYLNIPAHTRHRVEWTTPGEPTIWLAVFHGAKDSVSKDQSGKSAKG